MQTSARYQVSFPSADRSDAPDVATHLINIVGGLERSAMFGQGPIASRPTSTVGTPGIQGRLYASTDETPQQLYYDYGTGWFQVGALAAGSIGTTQLADGSVVLAKLAANSVDSSKIVDGSIVTGDIADGTITAGDLAAALKPSQGAGAGTEALRALGTAAGQAAQGESGAPLGAIMDFAGTADPNANWLICDGRSLLRTGTYASLFSVIGTAYGFADGTHFNLPDCRGRVTVGVDGAAGRLTGPDTLGASSGEEKHLLTAAELASHTHPVAPGMAAYAGTSFISQVASGANFAAVNSSHAATGSAGGDTPHNVMQPYVVTNKIIRVL